MPAVKSSNIRAIDYAPDQRRLTVEFDSGSRYAYAGVDPSVYDAFLSAPSKGAFFHGHIKGRYSYQPA